MFLERPQVALHHLLLVEDGLAVGLIFAHGSFVLGQAIVQREDGFDTVEGGLIELMIAQPALQEVEALIAHLFAPCGQAPLRGRENGRAMRRDRHQVTIGIGRCLGRLRSLVRIVVSQARVFDEDVQRLVVVVVHAVDDALNLVFLEGKQFIEDVDRNELLLIARLLRHLDAEINGVGQENFAAGRGEGQHRFAGILPGLHHGQRPALQGQARVVLETGGDDRIHGMLTPVVDALLAQERLRLQNGHHGRAAALDGDGRRNHVAEKFALGLPRRRHHRRLGQIGDAHLGGGRWRSHVSRHRPAAHAPHGSQRERLWGR